MMSVNLILTTVKTKVNKRYFSKETPLSLAVQHKFEAYVESLLEKGAKKTKLYISKQIE